MHLRLTRRALALASLTVGALSMVPATASAEVTVDLKLSSAYAIIGFPVTATVTASESGTLTLHQGRPYISDGAGLCQGGITVAQRRVAGTTRPITAGVPLRVTIQPSALFYAGGSPFPPPGWGTAGGPQCWDRLTRFDTVTARIATPAAVGEATRPLSRLL